MIDEKKLIYRLERMKKECTTLKEALFFDGIIGIVETQPKIGAWISAEERMPEERESIYAKRYEGTIFWKKGMFKKISDEVIVTLKFEDGQIKTATAHTIDGNWIANKYFMGRVFKVIAWKPMPEPYKAGRRMSAYQEAL